ncbi:hypothetical protein [Chroococcidiopsis sp.]|uniref:hypothetical protein n=1 Tax=Chroococcidiopsis sp. TaxID=3088168 RepID=UPI003F2C894B
MYQFLSQSDRYRIPELMYSDALAAEIGGKREVVCGAGRIDVLTSKEVIEVKRIANYKEAVGQVTLYGTYYPSLGKRIHLIGHPTLEEKEDIEIVCNRAGIRVTWDEMKVGVSVSLPKFLKDHIDQITLLYEFLKWSAPRAWEIFYLALKFRLAPEHCQQLCHSMLIEKMVEIAPLKPWDESQSFYIPILKDETVRFGNDVTRSEIFESFMRSRNN